ncbi:MAG TPA: LPS export ABC transporter permease LptF [Pseudomonadales bacterium]|nr:LPS export ABC transporter permease LptF [Pseudomonadales bacterium]
MLIERYITSEILRPFAAGLAMLATVSIAFSAAVRLSEAATGEIAAPVVARLIFLNTLVSLEVLIPTTLFLAVLFAIGRLHRDSEMTALQSAGVGEARVLWTVAKLALVCALLAGWISTQVRPWAFARSYELEQQSIGRFDISNIRAGSFTDMGSGGYVLYTQEVDPQEEELRNVFVQVDHGARTQVIAAARARIHDMDAEGSRSVEFFDGYTYLLERDGPHDVETRFGSFLIRFPQEERIERFRRRAAPTAALAGSDNPKEIAEYQWRLTSPLATLLLGLLAVPLSRANPRQSRGGVLAVALGAYMLLFALVSGVRNSLESGDIPAFPGMLLAYLPPLLLLVALFAAPRLRLARIRR